MYGKIFACFAINLVLIQSPRLGSLEAQAGQNGQSVYKTKSQAIEDTYKYVFEKDCVLTFSATWCKPCKTQHQINEILKKKGYRVWEADIMRNEDLYRCITTTTFIPFTCIIKKGKVVKSWIGIVNLETIEQEWKKW